jgi:hypothetical protein
MKNLYVIETLETCKVWKQYKVEAYTMDDAKRIVMGGEIFEQPVELDHYIDQDLGVDEFLSIKHYRTVEEV